MPPKHWSRRGFLAAGAGFPLAALALPPDEELVPFNDYGPEFQVEAQADHPRVKCFDLRRLTTLVTPADEFFAFHQTETVRAEAAGWRLRVGGLVKRPVELTLADLQHRPGRDVAAAIECSGNSGDARLMNGLVSNGVWTGVSLAALLNECGVLPEAREVVFLGMDAEEEPKFEAGNAPYLSPHGRSLFVQDALSPGPLLAFAMNGRPLPPEHGFPLRLVMPGWYGMAQVKWLTRIQVIDRRYEGRQMARNYQSLHAVESPQGAIWLDTSISRNNLKSVIARVTRRGSQYRIAGAAWGGEARIESVAVQVDGGPWQPAAIDQRSGDAAWVLWSAPWNQPSPGLHILVSRATNARGDVQPTREELRRQLASNREDNSQWARTLIIPSGR